MSFFFMINTADNTFNFFVPFDKIEKSKDENGVEVMKIKGVASTTALDSDSEILEPSGFQLDKFLKSGFINYNHKSGTDPAALIGEPTRAFIKDNELHIEGILYADNPIAKSVFSMAQILEKNSKTRRLGYSIEGKVLEKSATNSKHITKASITGLAVTPTPKNPKTLLQLMKGEADLYTDFEYDNSTYEELEKAIEADGGDSNFEDAKQESVEGTKKKEKEKKIKALTKGEIYVEILGNVTQDIHKAKQIYSLVEKISSMEGKEITNETLAKAYNILELAGQETATSSADIQKAEAIEAKRALDEAKITLQKAEEAYAKTVEQPGAAAPEGTQKKDQGEKDKDGDDAEILSHAKKGDDSPTLSVEQIVEGLSKSISPKFAAVADIFKAQDEENLELKKAIDYQGEILTRLGEKLQLIEKEKAPRKSIASTSFLEKGESAEVFEKGAPGTKVFSVSRDKARLVDFLFQNSNIQKGENVNQLYATAASNLETAGQIAGTEAELSVLLKSLKNELNVEIVG